MSSDYEYSDDDAAYYDDEDMLDGTQDDEVSDDDMDMDIGDDFKVSTKGKRKSYEVEHESLSQAAVEKVMRDDAEHTSGILGVELDIAKLLLRHSSWNKEKLIEQYMDNPTKVMVSAGIVLPEVDPQATPTPARTQTSNSSSTRRPTRSTSKLLSSFSSGSRSSKSSSGSPPSSCASPKALKKADEPFVCPICFDDDPKVRTLSLDCEHTFCSGCWTAYITSKIRDEGEHYLRCMAEGCALVTSDTFIRSVLVPEQGSQSITPAEAEENLKVWSRFQELLVRHFVSCNPDLKFCPYPSCTNTVSCPAASSKLSLTSIVPIVSCGARGIGGQEQSQSQSQSSLGGKEHKFCFGCPVESDHRPVICNVAKMWLKKCRDDSETANWIKSNTKECSQCQSTIEKNGGCNHMTCKKCKHEFCWVCMGPWSEHGTAWYSCNRYDEKAGQEARDAQSRSRASLERYLHYYNRWANHEQSAKLSVDLYAKTEKKMEEMQITSALTWIEVQFMKKAVEEVEKCRMTLKWTYAMAYYLAKGNEKELFEDNQRDLEKAVEDLSELLESPLEPENIPTLRQQVTNKTVYVQKRNEIVLEDTANGFLEGRWKWNAKVEGFDDPDPSLIAI
ncbi:RING-5 domain-containing protein [Coprinopsis cinerea okayama7|uniref:RBR-type E3 ubiquitin transferase n=1 Tax=Coprinopsis cinerea (strain Okayama-7 / 130 / ATCC MYA-4618 / FGSC 9003) TaxID=240176 RepID=A8N7Q8_COPC7|nr:RING-5 domain-containing protein [Coprinopsis cinerea okayama7\|eukprot:XP_001830864.1 RING-5 domain-containing protein [Coprinopsis cinerea okayama7\